MVWMRVAIGPPLRIMCTAVSLDRQSINLLREGFQVKDKRSEEAPSSSEGVLRAQHAPLGPSGFIEAASTLSRSFSRGGLRLLQ